MKAVCVLLLLAGCTTSSSTNIHTCDIPATLGRPNGPVGSTVTATGEHFTQTYDTLVQVGGVQAKVSSVTRTDCTICDACVASEINASACDACGPCAACVDSCATCVSRTRLDSTVPAPPTSASPRSLRVVVVSPSRPPAGRIVTPPPVFGLAN